MMYGSGYNNMMGGGWFGWLLWAFFGLLVLVGVVVLVIWVVRSMSGHQSPPGQTQHPTPSGRPGHEEAIAIARRRLASGEITKEEYDGIIQALGT